LARMAVSVVVRQPASSAIINLGTRSPDIEARGRGISEAVGSENGALADQVALVTGASSGLGKATAFALARAGADVALAARSREELESTKEEVSNTGRRVLTLPVDLASEVEPVEVVERTVEALEGIDVLVNAAGTDVPGTVEELDVEGWDRTLAVNLRAPFLLSKATMWLAREGLALSRVTPPLDL
jgi:NAD(P)-dependent dehydrogenase (short-subunit alcohol dehydrogenase family)